MSGSQPGLAEILITKGFVANTFLLDLDKTLQTPSGFDSADPWNLPSRLFKFPLEVQPDKNGKLRIGLIHPGLQDHPFVKVVAEAIRPLRITKHGAPNAYDYSHTRGAAWWHAVDLIDRWKDLLRTRQFTTDPDIIRAIVYGLDYSRLRTGDARAILSALGVAEPLGRRTDSLNLLMDPQIVKPDNSAPYWPLNPISRAAHDNVVGNAWVRIYGIEAGWFAYRSKFLQWSEAGRALFNGRPRQLQLF